MARIFEKIPRGVPEVSSCSDGENEGKPQCRIIVYNIGKRHNIGTITRSAVAFGVNQIIIVGNKKVDEFGNQNTRKFMRFEYYPTLEECKDSLKLAGFSIIGVEIGADAMDVSSHPFTGPTAFIFGNEGSGLHAAAVQICDHLVYIPQYTQGTASLNVAVAASIVLHHFALWAKYTPSAIIDQKFVVDESKVVEPFMFASSSYQKQRLLLRQGQRGEGELQGREVCDEGFPALGVEGKNEGEARVGPTHD